MDVTAGRIWGSASPAGTAISSRFCSCIDPFLSMIKTLVQAAFFLYLRVREHIVILHDGLRLEKSIEGSWHLDDERFDTTVQYILLEVVPSTRCTNAQQQSMTEV
jgi:hypothetical protein